MPGVVVVVPWSMPPPPLPGGAEDEASPTLPVDGLSKGDNSHRRKLVHSSKPLLQSKNQPLMLVTAAQKALAETKISR
ncbi:hypothetical protein ACA910_019008 [Epithemia clementina (nom. ined.)]